MEENPYEPPNAQEVPAKTTLTQRIVDRLTVAGAVIGLVLAILLIARTIWPRMFWK